METKPGVTQIIGLTGNIACGKSSVAKLLSDFGIPIIDADQLSREVVKAGSPTLNQIVQIFGAEVLNADDELDRVKLRKLVFNDPKKRKKLEGVLHPAIQKRSLELIQHYTQAGHQKIVYEAALLVETGRHEEFAGLLLVTCSPVAQLSRLLARDKTLTPELATQIVQAQMAQSEKQKLATWTLENSGTPYELKEKVKAWYQSIL